MLKETSREIRMTNRLFLFLVVTAVFAPFALSGLFAQGGIYENAGVNQSTIVSELLYFVIAAVFILLGGRKIFESVLLGNLKPGSVFWIVILSFFVQPVMLWLNMITMSFARNYVAESVVRASGSFVINLLYLAVLPALVEEFVFRGLIYHGLRGLGVWKAALLSALMFALLHLNVNQFAYAFVLGIIFAFIVEITGSLYSSMILHFLINSRSVSLLSNEELVNSMLLENSAHNVVTAGEYLTSAAVYTPVALLCLGGVWWALHRLAKSCDREFFLMQPASEETGSGMVTPALFAGIALAVFYIIRYDLF